MSKLVSTNCTNLAHVARKCYHTSGNSRSNALEHRGGHTILSGCSDSDTPGPQLDFRINLMHPDDNDIASSYNQSPLYIST